MVYKPDKITAFPMFRQVEEVSSRAAQLTRPAWEGQVPVNGLQGIPQRSLTFLKTDQGQDLMLVLRNQRGRVYEIHITGSSLC